MIEYEKDRSGVDNYLYHQSDINLNFGLHIHKSFEFIYIFDGNLTLTIENKSYDIPKGSAALILPHQVHSYQTKGSSKSYLCVFSTSYLYEYYEKTKDSFVVNPLFDFSKYEYIIDELKTEKQNHYNLKACFYKILYCFTANINYLPRDKKLHDLIETVLSYIENHFNEEISLAELSLNIGYDYHYLSGLLNKMFHTNFLKLVNEYRISHAHYLLSHSELNMTQISEQCGYDSIRSFNRNFIQISGIPPKEYKKDKKD